jgi:hypothetical protein
MTALLMIDDKTDFPENPDEILIALRS